MNVIYYMINNDKYLHDKYYQLNDMYKNQNKHKNKLI